MEGGSRLRGLLFGSAAFALVLGGTGLPARAAPPVEGLAAFKASLHPATQSKVDLRNYQTPVKTQYWSGNCFTFALVGAIEAFYKRRCIKDPSLALTEPYCARQLAGTDLDLAEWQFFHDMATQSPTRNPAASHEGLSSPCSFQGYRGNPYATWATHDAVLAAARGILITEEADNPWPDEARNQAVLAEAMGLVPLPGVDYGGFYCNPDPPLADMNTRFDRLAYDPANVPYSASYKALYGATAVQGLPTSDVKRPANLELYLANEYEVDISLDPRNLRCDLTDLLDGAVRCRYDAGRNDLGKAGHVMLLVGYDRTRSLFLFKNSWGSAPGYYPYVWIPYPFLKVRMSDQNSHFIVRGVRPAVAGGATREQGFLGSWAVFDPNRHYEGRLVIRRTREMPDAFLDYRHAALRAPYVTEDSRLRRTTRLGTFITPMNRRKKAYGYFTAARRLKVFVLPDNTGPGGDLRGTGYSGGAYWGGMFLTSADTARDGDFQTYVRDFAGRAAGNWVGTWDLRLIGPQVITNATLVVTSHAWVPNADGRYTFRATYQDPTLHKAIVGYVDRRGEHARYEFERTAVGGALELCALDLAHRRTVEGQQVWDRVAEFSSVLACEVSGVRRVSGTKRVYPTPEGP